MDSIHIAAVDVHAHFGDYANGRNALTNHMMSGDPASVVRRAAMARTCLSIVSPLQALMPRGHGEVLTGNESAVEAVERTPGLLQWVVVDPRNPATFEQAAQMLKHPKCVGIKIHPEEHLYPIADYGRALFEFAAAHATVVLSHTGERNSIPADLVRFADEFPSVQLILAHLGCGWDGDLTHQVRAIQSSRHGNVFTDTSSAASLTPNLIEWAVGEIGPERILFGSDSPLYFAPMQRSRIDHADLSVAAKQMILRDNAWQLFNLKECVNVQ